MDNIYVQMHNQWETIIRCPYLVLSYRNCLQFSYTYLCDQVIQLSGSLVVVVAAVSQQHTLITSHLLFYWSACIPVSLRHILVLGQPVKNIVIRMNGVMRKGTYALCVKRYFKNTYGVIQKGQGYNPLTYEPRHEKTCFCHMQTTKTQISLRLRAVWSAPCCLLLR